MAEYIERDWLYDQMNSTGQEFSLIDALEMIEKFPAADVAPVRHGRWDFYRDSDYISAHYRCSVCNAPRYEHYAYNAFQFCPNCGAKMDGGGRK